MPTLTCSACTHAFEVQAAEIRDNAGNMLFCPACGNGKRIPPSAAAMGVGSARAKGAGAAGSQSLQDVVATADGSRRPGLPVRRRKSSTAVFVARAVVGIVLLSGLAVGVWAFVNRQEIISAVVDSPEHARLKAAARVLMREQMPDRTFHEMEWKFKAGGKNFFTCRYKLMNPPIWGNAVKIMTFTDRSGSVEIYGDGFLHLSD